MNFYNYIKGLLSSSNQHENNFLKDRSQSWNREEEEEKTYRPYDRDQIGFHIFSDPFEMHRYFEHQMNEILKSFGMHEHGPTFFESFHFPTIGEHSDQDFMPDQSSDNLRDHYLKPGYENENRQNKMNRIDSDIDGRLDISDLDTVLKSKQSQPSHKIHFFGQSSSTRTIQNADGTIETHRTVKNNDGTEETTITNKRGDQEYTVIKRRDKDGKEEMEENFVNMDKKDVKKIFKGVEPLLNPKLPHTSSPNWFNFDEYFK